MLARAAAEVEAANLALAHVGESRIASLDENRLAARAIRDLFGTVRDALIRAHVWNFALAWKVLAQDPTLPQGSFSKLYPLPGDCLRVVSVENAEPDAWSVEAGDDPDGAGANLSSCLATELDAPRIAYLRRVANPRRWDASFLEIFALRLAAAVGPQLGRDAAAIGELLATAERKLSSARRIDAREAAGSRLSTDVPFVAVRR